MKKFKKIVALMMVAALAMLPIAAFADSVYEDEGTVVEFEVTFLAFTGEVVSIEPLVVDDEPVADHYFITLDLGVVTAVFRTDDFTFVLGDPIAVGDTITGFHDANLAVPMIYPTQYSPKVIVNGDFENVAVDRFDEELVSFDGSLQLIIGEDTEVILQSGAAFDGDLTNRALVVVYDVSTRSIPAITTRSLVVVLYERIIAFPDPVELDDDGYDPADDEVDDDAIVDDEDIVEDDIVEDDEIDWSQYAVIVNGVGLADVGIATIGDYIFPTHVQLRPVLAAFEITPGWNSATREVTFTNIHGEVVVFQVGTNVVTVGGEVVTLHQETVLINDRTYVPLGFFRDALGVNNAYFLGGHVYIDNDELMQ